MDNEKEKRIRLIRILLGLLFLGVIVRIVIFQISPLRQDRLEGPEERKAMAVKSTDKPAPPTAAEKPSPSPKPKPDTKKLKKMIEKDINDFPGEVGFIYYDFETGAELKINSDGVFESASLVKIPIMAAVFNKISEGDFKADDEMELNDKYKTGGSGILKNEIPGTKWKIQKLTELMITKSDNTATDMLIDKVGMKEIEKLAHKWGMKDTTLRRKIFEFYQIDLGLDNLTTPDDMFLILKRIYKGASSEDKDSQAMVEILKKQKRNNMIPAKLPENVKCAHKTGGLTGFLHDCGIVYPENRKPYIIVLMSKKVTDPQKAEKVFADISKKVYDFTLDKTP